MNARRALAPLAPGGSVLGRRRAFLVTYRPLATADSGSPIDERVVSQDLARAQARIRTRQPTGQSRFEEKAPVIVMDAEQRSAKTDEASDHEYGDEDDTCCDVFPFMKLPDEIRGRALEYLLSASEAHSAADPWDEPEPERVPYSAAASLDTLLFHARDIKTVCKAIARVVRLMERRTATPTAWIKGLWGIANPNYGARKQRSRADVIEDCRERAKIAAHANLVLELSNRLTTSCGTRDRFVQTPRGWSQARRDAVEQLDEDRVPSAWAHIRVRSQDEAKGYSPIERVALANVLDSTAEIFGMDFAAQQSWTLLVSSVSLVYRGATEGGEMVDADDAAYDEVDARLGQFFGAKTLRSKRWIQAWANGGDRPGSTMSLEQARNLDPMGSFHDESRPPVRRIRDVRDYDGTRPYMLNLTHKGTKPVGTVDIWFKSDAEAQAQANPEEPDSAPPYYFIGPVRSVCWGGRARVKTSSQFKIGSNGMCGIRGTRFETGILFVQLVPGVFEAQLDCCVAGLS